MSVTFGSPVSSNNVNNAFISKTTDSTGTAKYTLNRVASGDQVDDVQRKLNDSDYKSFVTEEISSSGTITTTVDKKQYRRVKGLAGSQTASVTPFGTGTFVDGVIIRLVGANDSETLTLINNDASKGCILNGDIELNKYTMLELRYDSVFDRFIEMGRN